MHNINKGKMRSVSEKGAGGALFRLELNSAILEWFGMLLLFHIK